MGNVKINKELMLAALRGCSRAKSTGDLVRQCKENPEKSVVAFGNYIMDICADRFGGSLEANEYLVGAAQNVEKEVAGSNPSFLDRLLAQRVAVCWLQIQATDSMAARAREKSDIDFWNKQLDRANKRYLSAIKTLASIRKLNISSIQLNIADKQINTVGIRSEEEIDIV